MYFGKSLLPTWYILINVICVCFIASSPEAIRVVRGFTPIYQGEKGQQALLKKDASLERVVTLSISSRPLGEILASLSQSSDIPLEAVHSIRDQRLTLSVTNAKLSEVMLRISELLSHRVDGGTDYVWERDLQKSNGYLLVVGPTAHESERLNLAKPWRDAAKRMTDMRNLALLPKGEQRNQYKSDYPLSVYDNVDINLHMQALKALSETQWRNFLQGRDVSISAEPLQPALDAERLWIWQQAKKRNPSLAPLDPVLISSPSLTLHLKVSDGNGEYPQRADWLLLDLQGLPPQDYYFGHGAYVSGFGSIAGNMAGLLSEEQSPILSASAQKEPVYDLAPLLEKAPREKRLDLGFNLSVLAQVTGMAIYEEHFLRPAGTFGIVSEARVRKGTLAQLVNGMCRTWGYEVHRDGNTLFFWSPNWARDRQNDISEKTLAPWREYFRRKIAQNSAATSNTSIYDYDSKDQIDIALAFTWPQIVMTLSPDLLRMGGDRVRVAQGFCRREYLSTRAVAAFTPEERAAAMRKGGVPLRQLSPVAQAKVLSELDIATFWMETGKEGSPPTPDDLLGVSVTLSPARPFDESAKLDYNPASLHLVATDGTVIWFPKHGPDL